MESTMQCLGRPLLALVTCVALTSRAKAEGWTIGAETLSDRAPGNFGESTATKFQVNAERTFASGAVIGGSFEPQIKADNQEVSYNLEATLGYMWKLNHLGSFGGSAGVGRRFQQESSGGNFSYYVVRVRADIDLSERWSWNVITYRFRDAFNTANDYNTPEASTTITLKFDQSSSVYLKYYYAWKDGSPDNQGIGMGWKHSF
jgi:hypothetical protein